MKLGVQHTTGLLDKYTESSSTEFRALFLQYFSIILRPIEVGWYFTIHRDRLE